mmetsp:Transcript_19078/g.41145  ORF Transcript_19078/g.41145 Transcript_19078/m.41145 type:complete len:412 (+) Transcript_19078:52-1287(+)
MSYLFRVPHATWPARVCRTNLGRGVLPVVIKRRQAWQRRVVPAVAYNEKGSFQVALDSYFKRQARPTNPTALLARQGFLAEVQKGDAMDLVNAALYIAAEDEAVKSSASGTLLPVDSFSARLDSMVSECALLLSPDMTPQAQLDCVQAYLYGTWGLKIAKGMAQGEQFSPYRVYMHHVLTQRCGTPAAAAAILHTLLVRLVREGALSSGSFSIGLPIASMGRPVVVLEGGAEAGVALKCAGMMRWVDPAQVLAEMLGHLKRFYWSWEWSTGSVSGFDSCAGALLNPGAAAVAASLQPRPFASVELSVLATERKALVTQAVDPDCSKHAAQIRDLGALLLHAGRLSEGLYLLEGYQDWLAAPCNVTDSASLADDPACQTLSEREEASDSFAVLVAELLHYERRKGLDEALRL